MQHKRSLAKIRKLVNYLIVKLEEILNSSDAIEELPAEWKHIWGEKENAVSALTKLTSLLVKVIPAEREILDIENENSKISEIKNNLSDEDKEIIQRYFERWKIKNED